MRSFSFHLLTFQMATTAKAGLDWNLDQRASSTHVTRVAGCQDPNYLWMLFSGHLPGSCIGSGTWRHKLALSWDATAARGSFTSSRQLLDPVSYQTPSAWRMPHNSSWKTGTPIMNSLSFHIHFLVLKGFTEHMNLFSLFSLSTSKRPQYFHLPVTAAVSCSVCISHM